MRLLIADDVGIGKTIESAMIARELLDRGIARRLAVICPPHLCDQWEQELREKFNLETAVIQPSRIGRLEREVPRQGVSIYKHFPHLVVSIDYVKSIRNRFAFIENAPDLIIVDEAHTAARPRGNRGRQQQQRHEFLSELMKSKDRHLILTTATPHSGIEESFRSLLGLLDPQLDLPPDQDLTRARLVPHLVQRRRADIRNWLGADTPFPERASSERTYQMAPEYLKLFEDVVDYCRESVAGAQGLRQHQQRVRYWAALAILRCVLSSPAAASAVLENRAQAKAQGVVISQEQEPDPDEIFRHQVFDSSEEEQPPDYIPTGPVDDPASSLTASDLRRLDGFLRTARGLRGPNLDTKLAETGKAVSELLREGYSPIVYCRFIATAQYVAERLQEMLQDAHQGLSVVSVSGDDGNSEQRRDKVDELAKEKVRVLVATDCLSEGINLQEHYNAVIHYDLPWNPNRLEQRIGRVDRYGQAKDTVKEVLLHGVNNQIDLVVLEVLLRKNAAIRDALGVSVPMPVDSDRVVETLIETVLLRQSVQTRQLQLGLSSPEVSQLHDEWDRASERERDNRSYFAQQGIKPDEVERELEEMKPALGSPDDLLRFVGNALQRFGGRLDKDRRTEVYRFSEGDLGLMMRQRYGGRELPETVIFDGIQSQGHTLLGRNHPIVEALTSSVLGRALAGEDPQFARCGAIFTDAVQVRTAVAVLRLRYLMREATDQFAEEVIMAAFQPDQGGIRWLEPLQQEAIRLMENAQPSANMPSTEVRSHLGWALASLEGEDWHRGLGSVDISS
ncbi:MAG: helicase-related protein [Chloroflexi bacterium]|nr:helicase-related protein [Chloroflexota bacterium]